MAIKRIKLTNFKSFRESTIELAPLNVLIGGNASGKSNFINVFRFLKSIETDGLQNAISMQGGIPYLRNITMAFSETLSVEIISDNRMRFAGRSEQNEPIGVQVLETTYRFALEFSNRGTGYRIADDRLLMKCEFFRLELDNNKIKGAEGLGNGELTLFRSEDRIKFNLTPPEGLNINQDGIVPVLEGGFIMAPTFLQQIEVGKHPENTLLLQPPFSFVPTSWGNIFSDIAIYDFDPKLPKKSVQITGKAELEEDGSNLAIVLSNILANKSKKRKLLNLLQDVLPFIKTVSIEKLADRSMVFSLKEIYSQKFNIPSSFVSDGTINITALIVALYFQDTPTIIIEEPERNIHPFLISKVVTLLKDASEQKQILVTTHNPEVVRYADLSSILLISRDAEGFSQITKPVQQEMVQTFLENEIGMAELFTQNLLGI